MMLTSTAAAVFAALCLSTSFSPSAASTADQQDNPMLTEALDLMARASSTSEVLTLNLTNLLILLVLKALIFGFGLFSFGGGAAGRSADEGSLFGVTQSDVTGGICFLNFMSGEESKFDCIRRSACEDPKTGNDYLTAAKMWYKMHTFVKAVPFHDTYYKVVEGLEESIAHSMQGGDCSVYQW
jgi:hypothetical protein